MNVNFENIMMNLQLFLCYILHTFPRLYQFLQFLHHLFYPTRKLPKEADTFNVYLTLTPSLNLLESDATPMLVTTIATTTYGLLKMKSSLSSAPSSIFYLGYRGMAVLKENSFFKHSCFLSVEYSCQDTRLYIDLGPEYWIQGSEILNVEFVCWWLKYHCKNRYFFHESYQLHILDSDLNAFTIGYGQSILLGGDSKYQIRET